MALASSSFVKGCMSTTHGTRSKKQNIREQLWPDRKQLRPSKLAPEKGVLGDDRGCGYVGQTGKIMGSSGSRGGCNHEAMMSVCPSNYWTGPDWTQVWDAVSIHNQVFIL